MPIYEYRCTACGEELELMQSIKAEPAKTCPACGADALRRLISSTSFVLKGSGWSQTDYGGKKPSGPSGQDTAAAGSGSSGDSASGGGAGDKGASSGSSSDSAD